MIDDPFDSGFELFVLEGGSVGSRWLLTRARLTLGRHDPLDEPQPNVLAFPEPTVSRVHAVLEWDRRRFRYNLVHRSRTNATMVNGEVVQHAALLEPGDKIQMGQLVLEVRRIDARQAALVDFPEPAVPVETEIYLVVAHGPSCGEICPLNYSRMEVHAPLDEPTLKPGLYVQGLAGFRLSLVQRDGHLYIEAPDGPRPTLLLPYAGMVYERRIGIHERPRFPREALLVCGEVAFVQVGVERAGVLAELLRRGDASSADIHPLFGGARFGAEPLWGGVEVHALRLLSGTARNSMLWVRPQDLEGPIILGPEGADPRPHMVILDPNAPCVSVRFEGDRLLARNESSHANFNHNWDAIGKGGEASLVSGDRMTMGRRMVAYEHVPSQMAIEGLAIRHGTRELPLIRAINRVGYTPDNELRINDRRLGATHGTVLFREGAFYYQHEYAPCTVLVGEKTVAMGEEVEIREGDHMVLADGVEVDVVRRSSTHRPSDPILIGPTQAQMEADRLRRLQQEAEREAQRQDHRETVEMPILPPAEPPAASPVDEADAFAAPVVAAEPEPTPAEGEVAFPAPVVAAEPEPTPVEGEVAFPAPVVAAEPEPTPVEGEVAFPAPVVAAEPEPTPAEGEVAFPAPVVAAEPEPTPAEGEVAFPAPVVAAEPEPTPAEGEVAFPAPVVAADPEPTPVEGEVAFAAPVVAAEPEPTPVEGEVAHSPAVRVVTPGNASLESELQAVLAEMDAEEVAVEPVEPSPVETDASKHE